MTDGSAESRRALRAGFSGLGSVGARLLGRAAVAVAISTVAALALPSGGRLPIGLAAGVIALGALYRRAFGARWA
jgi:hypothetical protein